MADTTFAAPEMQLKSTQNSQKLLRGPYFYLGFPLIPVARLKATSKCRLKSRQIAVFVQHDFVIFIIKSCHFS